MADLLDNCRFLAGSMGTADFSDGTADPTFRNLEDAGAEDGKTYPYKAQNATGTEWEIGRGMALNTSGGWILERTTIQDSSNGGSKVNFGTAPKVIITAGKEEFGAETITYDPIDSGLSATDVQDAVDELAAKIQSEWRFMPIGVPIPVSTDLFATLAEALPPTDQTYRYVLLTAGEDGSGEYNEGILTGENVTGSAPLVVATAVIDLDGSPLDGKTVHLINTEGRFLRGSTSAGAAQNDQMQQITGSFNVNLTALSGTPSGAFSVTNSGNSRPNTGANSGFTTANFDSANSPDARAGNETRSKNLGVTYIMRIK